jgi:hypothetical protein
VFALGALFVVVVLSFVVVVCCCSLSCLGWLACLTDGVWSQVVVVGAKEGMSLRPVPHTVVCAGVSMVFPFPVLCRVSVVRVLALRRGVNVGTYADRKRKTSTMTTTTIMVCCIS